MSSDIILLLKDLVFQRGWHGSAWMERATKAWLGGCLFVPVIVPWHGAWFPWLLAVFLACWVRDWLCQSKGDIVNRIWVTIAYIWPPKLLASLQAHNIARFCESDRVGHRFGNPWSLAWRPSLWSSRKLVANIFAIRLKFNGRKATLYKNIA